MSYIIGYTISTSPVPSVVSPVSGIECSRCVSNCLLTSWLTDKNISTVFVQTPMIDIADSQWQCNCGRPVWDYSSLVTFLDDSSRLNSGRSLRYCDLDMVWWSKQVLHYTKCGERKKNKNIFQRCRRDNTILCLPLKSHCIPICIHSFLQDAIFDHQQGPVFQKI